MRLNGFAWLVILFSFAATAKGENVLPKIEPKTPTPKTVDAVAVSPGHEDKPSEKSIQRLIRSFQNSDESTRWKAGEELIRSGILAVPALIRAMQDDNAGIRREAAFVLARIGSASKPAVPALRAALNDADADVRWYAAFALRSIEPVANAKQSQPKHVSSPTEPTFQMPVIVESGSAAEEASAGPVLGPVRVVQNERKDLCSNGWLC